MSYNNTVKACFNVYFAHLDQRNNCESPLGIHSTCSSRWNMTTGKKQLSKREMNFYSQWGRHWFHCVGPGSAKPPSTSNQNKVEKKRLPTSARLLEAPLSPPFQTLVPFSSIPKLSMSLVPLPNCSYTLFDVWSCWCSWVMSYYAKWWQLQWPFPLFSTNPPLKQHVQTKMGLWSVSLNLSECERHQSSNSNRNLFHFLRLQSFWDSKVFKVKKCNIHFIEFIQTSE